MSAEMRLTIWNGDEESDTTDDNAEIFKEVKERMMKIINCTITGEGLENLRTKLENIDMFHTFVSYCLIHFTTSINWRYKACSVVVSEIFSESDEALCILLIENNAEDYARMHREQRKITRKEAKPKYTKVEIVERRFKGWDKRGIRRFNELVAAIKKNRELNESKDMELQLKSRYCEITGKGAEDSEDDSDFNDSELDELNGYDGFAGVTEVSNNATTENESVSGDCNGVTNVTAL